MAKTKEKQDVPFELKVDILGGEWTVKFKKHGTDSVLNTAAGYVDETERLIIIKDFDREKSGVYQDTVILHELIHVYFMECGLFSSTLVYGKPWSTNEEMTDFFASNIYKIVKTHKEIVEKLEKRK